LEHSKPAFLLAEAESSGVKVSRFHGETDEVREALRPIPQLACVLEHQAATSKSSSLARRGVCEKNPAKSQRILFAKRPM
jgi:hypothetical protein